MRTNSENQTSLNGFYYSTASLLLDLAGKVELEMLEKLTAEFAQHSLLLGATQENIDKAMFRTCNLFEITVNA